MKQTLRIYSWNVNGIRSCTRKGFADWFASTDMDMLALQEVRAKEEQIEPSVRQPTDWHVTFSAAERAGYSGVGLYSREAPTARCTELGDAEIDREGRLIIADFGGLKVVNGYFPNGKGKERDNGRVPFKMRFYKLLFEQLEAANERGEAILVMGDLNTAHREIDLARPKANVKISGFLPEEREELDRWLRAGWVDTFRQFHPEEPEHYSWWSQRAGARARNVGWRIDYILASRGAQRFVRGAKIHPEVLGSDHCPISVDVDRAILKGA